MYTCFVGQHVDRVLAFEPHKQTAARLRENVELNGIAADVHEYAVADDAGTATLSHPRRSSQILGTGEFSLVTGGSGHNAVDVELIRGDTLVKELGLPRPTVAKIDVEGAELRVLNGFGDALDTCRTLFIEVHRDHVTVDPVEAWLRDAGFAPEVLKRRGNTTFLTATRADSKEPQTVRPSESTSTAPESSS